MAALYDGDDNRVFTASRKEGKNTYQLFQRKPKDTKSGRKSPYTAPSGVQHSLFWYGFSQNVLQALSALPQTIGSIWHSIFDDVSTAYHQKVAKDRATKEGIVVNPPELGNLPGQGEVTYASQVQDVLIPYTTREDTYNYYEERNYVNDVNREHTEVLETYDHDGKARETYSYGKGRASYLNNQTGDSYNYLTNQSGSVTGLTKDGQAVASTSYNLYGASKASTDTTGQPFAYNGEARDGTGLDYLRARYYDSQGGTFLSEDSYPGEDTDPLSQNRYSYVQNNPVNYTDPSGHRMIWAVDGSEPSRPRRINTRQQRIYQQSIVGQDILGQPLTLREYTDHRIKTDRNFRAPESYYQAFGPNVATYQGGSYGGQSSYAYTQQQAAYARAQAEQRRRQQIRYEYGLATGLQSLPIIREGLNLLRNWSPALENTLRHVCVAAERTKSDIVNFVKNNSLNIIKYSATFTSSLTSSLDKLGSILEAGESIGGLLRNINPIAKMGGKNGFVMPNTSSISYKAGTRLSKTGQALAPIAKILTSKTFQTVGFVSGIADDMVNQEKTFGQALIHNGVGLALGAVAVAATPVGWGLLGSAVVGVVANIVFDNVYNHNIGGVRDGLDWLGNKIDNVTASLFDPKKRLGRR